MALSDWQDNEHIKPKGTQKANDCIASVKHFKWPQRLFDEFWREGELALLFGPPGVGKSLFAVQLAEALARGRTIGMFRMQGYRRRTLYVDLVMSAAKFRLRYSNFPLFVSGEARPYKFSESLFRARPGPDAAIGAWLRKRIRDDRVGVVIIDDLAALRLTGDGTAESLRVMRELKEIVDEQGISMLVLASSRPPAKGALVEESNLRRTQAVCEVADNVFAIGNHPQKAGRRYFIQTRSRHFKAVWNEANAPVCQIGLEDDVLLSFIFEGSLAAKLDPEVQRTICEIKAAKDGGSSFRKIARELQIPISRAIRLYKKWTPEMGQVRNAEFGVRNGGSGRQGVSSPYVGKGSTRAANEHEPPRNESTDRAFPDADEFEEYDESDDEYLEDVGLDESETFEEPESETEAAETPSAA